MTRLLDAGQYVNERDAHGWTGLHLACAEGHTDVVRELVRAGAALDLQNAAGRTALELAQTGRHHKTAAVLRPGSGGRCVCS